MASGYASPPVQESDGPQLHPYLHDPILYISNLPPYVTDENLAITFQACAPFRPNIPRDGTNRPLSGTIEFKFFEKGWFICLVPSAIPGIDNFFTAEKALATLHSRPLQGLQPPVPLVLSPYPPTTPPTPLPPPSALPRLVKHLPVGFADSQLYDLFRPYGAIASVRTQTGFGSDTGVVEFWREEDACVAEEAMHCFELEGQNIAVTVYQGRRTSGSATEFSAHAPTFVPSGSVYPYPTQVITPLSVQFMLTKFPVFPSPGSSIPYLPKGCIVRPWSRTTGSTRPFERTWFEQS
jgi:polyadenylate-binding protein